MIYPQQQISKAFIPPVSQKYINSKISLKTNKTPNEKPRTKRNLSFQTSKHLPIKETLTNLKQQVQSSSIESMFRYCLAQKNCYGMFSCGKREYQIGEKIVSKTQLLYQTAQSLRSSSSNSINQKIHKYTQTQAGDRIISSKKVTSLNLLKQDSSFTDNDFILPEIDFTRLEILSNKRKSLCQKKTDRDLSKNDGVHAKFSLKNMQPNFPAVSMKIHKFNPQQIAGKDNYNMNQFFSQQIEAGCLCLPQCFWIDKWYKLIKDQMISESYTKNINPKILSQIQKDIFRTQPRQQFFQETKNRNSLKKVLLNYSLVSPSLGYVQGMNFIASILVYHSNNINQCSSIFSFIMKQKQYQRIYQGDLYFGLKLAKNISSQLQKLQPELFDYIMKSGIQIDIYLRSFYFSMFANFVPLQSMHLVIDKFIKKGFQGINRLLLALLVFLKNQILQLSSEEVALVFTISWLQKRCKRIDWMQLLGFSETIIINKVLF